MKKFLVSVSTVEGNPIYIIAIKSDDYKVMIADFVNNNVDGGVLDYEIIDITSAIDISL